jgi:hypothetical protein
MDRWAVLVALLIGAVMGVTWVGWGMAAREPSDPKPAGAPGLAGAGDITFIDDDPDQPEAGKGKAASPFGDGLGSIEHKDAVPGYIELSSGLKVPGRIYTTRAKRLKIYNLQCERYEYVPVAALKQIEGKVEWERMDKEWRFKEAGNPEKVYTGREYPVRMLAWTLTLRNDHEIVGHILGQPLYAEHNGKVERFILHKRDKGEMGRTLSDIPYIRRVVFGPEAYNQAVDELKAKAEAAEKQAAPAVPGPAKKK